MGNPKLYLILAIAAVILSCLSYFTELSAFSFTLSILILVLSNKELKMPVEQFTPQEFQNLKTAKRLSIIGIVISSLIIIYLLIILVVITMGFLSW